MINKICLQGCIQTQNLIRGTRSCLSMTMTVRSLVLSSLDNRLNGSRFKQLYCLVRRIDSLYFNAVACIINSSLYYADSVMVRLIKYLAIEVKQKESAQSSLDKISNDIFTCQVGKQVNSDPDSMVNKVLYWDVLAQD